MRGRGVCFGAATIVNAIAADRGAAFGIGLRVDADVEVGGPSIQVSTAEGEDTTLVEGCVRRVLGAFGRKEAGARVAVRSEIPVSRGLKSSSAVANAVTLATLRALGEHMADLEIIDVGIDAGLEAGVTITGAFDDACACFFGGIVLTDNRQRNILAMEAFDDELKVVLHIPGARQVRKADLPRQAFQAVRREAEEAFQLALRRDFYGALNLNGRAYARALGLDTSIAERARAAGAVASGITGTGPATVALCDPSVAPAVAEALQGPEAEVRVVDLNARSAVEVEA
jgi:shikimate kinase